MLPAVILVALSAGPAEARPDASTASREPESRPTLGATSASSKSPSSSKRSTSSRSSSSSSKRKAPSTPPASRPAPVPTTPRPTATPRPSAAPSTSRPTPTTPQPRAAPQPRVTPHPQATRPSPVEVDGRTVHEVQLGDRPTSGLRPYDGRDAYRSGGGHDQDRPRVVPPHRTSDVRYHRPAASVVRSAPYAHHHVPASYTYRHWYTRWYCHPWYRYQYSTVAVVSFGFVVYPWVIDWAPPPRAGFYWVPGQVVYGTWYPGYWAPVALAPQGYVYVNGWWEDDAYVDGYWRIAGRDGWVWVDGTYLDDGAYGRGHWRPETGAPDGYTWEAGFWDGEDWVDGFWRPQFRDGYLWVGAYYDNDGVFHGGYWSPLEDRPGQVWIPGWFDGNEWVEGYWVDASEVTDDALNDWTPPEGVDDGWGEQEQRFAPDAADVPLAIPVVVPE